MSQRNTLENQSFEGLSIPVDQQDIEQQNNNVDNNVDQLNWELRENTFKHIQEKLDKEISPANNMPSLTDGRPTMADIHSLFDQGNFTQAIKDLYLHKDYAQGIRSQFIPGDYKYDPLAQSTQADKHMDMYWRDARGQTNFLADKKNHPLNDVFQSWLIIAIDYVKSAMDRVEYVENLKFLQDEEIKSKETAIKALEAQKEDVRNKDLIVFNALIVSINQANRELSDLFVTKKNETNKRINQIRRYFADELIKLAENIEGKKDDKEIEGIVGNFLHNKLIRIVTESTQNSIKEEWELIQVARNFSTLDINPFTTVTLIQDKDQSTLANVEVPIFKTTEPKEKKTKDQEPKGQEPKNSSKKKRHQQKVAEFTNYLINYRTNKANVQFNTQLRTITGGIRNAFVYTVFKKANNVGSKFKEIFSGNHTGNVGHYFGDKAENQEATTEVVGELLTTFTKKQQFRKKQVDAKFKKTQKEIPGFEIVDGKPTINRVPTIGYNPNPNLLMVTLISPQKIVLPEEEDLHNQLKHACSELTDKNTDTGQEVWYANIPINFLRGWLTKDKTGIEKLANEVERLNRVLTNYLNSLKQQNQLVNADGKFVNETITEDFCLINLLSLTLERYNKLVKDRSKTPKIFRSRWPFDDDNFSAQLVAYSKVLSSVYNQALPILLKVPVTCADPKDSKPFRPVEEDSQCKSTKDREGTIREISIALSHAMESLIASNQKIFTVKEYRTIFKEKMQLWILGGAVQRSAGFNGNLGCDGCVGNSKHCYPAFLRAKESFRWLFPRHASFNKDVPVAATSSNKALVRGLIAGVACVAIAALVIGVLVASHAIALPLVLGVGGTVINAITGGTAGAFAASAAAPAIVFTAIGGAFVAGVTAACKGIRHFINKFHRPSYEDNIKDGVELAKFEPKIIENETYDPVKPKSQGKHVGNRQPKHKVSGRKLIDVDTQFNQLRDRTPGREFREHASSYSESGSQISHSESGSQIFEPGILSGSLKSNLVTFFKPEKNPDPNSNLPEFITRDDLKLTK